MRWQTPRGGDDDVLELRAFGGQAVDMRRGGSPIAVGRDVIGTQVVDHKDDYVGRPWSCGREICHSVMLLQPGSSLDCKKYQYKERRNKRKRPLPESPRHIFVGGKPAI